ncbi:MAG: hypothetical protein ACKO37_08345 [Vampirovibrionales bacterium]
MITPQYLDKSTLPDMVSRLLRPVRPNTHVPVHTARLKHDTSRFGETPESCTHVTDALPTTPMVKLFGLPYTVAQWRIRPQQHVSGPFVFPLHDNAIQGYAHRPTPSIPKLQQTLPKQTLVLGDTHGSWQKVVELLNLHGLLQCSPETWAELQLCATAMAKLQERDPYISKPYQQSFQARLDERIQNVLRQVHWGGTQAQHILFLGDVISDQGSSDLMTLRVLERLEASKQEQAQKQHAPTALTQTLSHAETPYTSAYEVVLSNHDMQALRDW